MKSGTNTLNNKRTTRTGGILQHPCPVRVVALMRLNRRVRNRTHGGVRGRGYLAPPTRLCYRLRWDCQRSQSVVKTHDLGQGICAFYQNERENLGTLFRG